MKKIVFALLLIFSINFLFARTLDFTFKFPTTMYLSNGDKEYSAPSPVVFSPGIGFVWPNEGFLAIEPSLNFYSSYYLWHDGRALPAEIENRTATTLSFLLDVPAAFTLDIKNTKLRFNAGAAMLCRFGWLSNGATESDDVTAINQYFWSKARFFYLSGGVSWMVPLTSTSKFGPFFNFYLPVGSIFAREGLNGMILSAGLKVSI
ncbi:MAG: hypothetical protein MJ181_10645 [Treponema sp.]|nr:hypothetical protein [Treponema sp.]